MHTIQRLFAVGILSASALTAVAAEAALPLGHPDFYPSPERPIGFRGDGNGYFPGATLVDGFWDGTPVRIESPYWNGGNPSNRKKLEAWDLTDDRSRNIAWKAPMPAWANSQPIVAGDLVFTTAEPDRIVCCDARSGEILWQDRVNVWEVAGKDPRQARIAHRLFDIVREATLGLGGMWCGGTMSRRVPSDEMADFLAAWQQDAPRVLAALQQADPKGRDWPAVMKQDIEGLRNYIEKLATLEATGDVPRTGVGDGLPGFNELGKQLDRRLKELSEGMAKGKTFPGPRLKPQWGNLVGFAASVPITDGRHVYVSFGQGQTACYSLDGKRIWATYRPQHGDQMSHYQALRLADGVLLDVHGGPDHVAGLDAATGRLLWEAPTRGDFAFARRGGYYVASSALMPLQNGDRIEHVVVTQCNNIIRVRDGRVLGPLPYGHGSSGGPSLAFSGDIVYRYICGDNTTTPLAAFRLSLSGDELTVEKLWESDEDLHGAGYEARVALPDHYLIPNRKGTIYEAATGTVVKHDLPLGGPSDLVVGTTWIWAAPLGDLVGKWEHRRWDDKALATFHAADISDLREPRALDKPMVLDCSELPRVPVMQELTPTLYAMPNYGYNSWGRPNHPVYNETVMYPHGKFLFIRTVASLYCIGPDGEAWHTPANAPAEARTGPTR